MTVIAEEVTEEVMEPVAKPLKEAMTNAITKTEAPEVKIIETEVEIKDPATNREEEEVEPEVATTLTQDK